MGIGELPKEVLIIVGVNPGAALVFAGIIMIALAGLTLDTCLRGLLLLADPSRRG